VVALKAVALTQVLGSSKDIRGDDGLEQACEFGIGEMNSIERLEVLAKVLLQSGAVADIRTIGVLQIFQLGDQILLDLVFRCRHEPSLKIVRSAQIWLLLELFCVIVYLSFACHLRYR